MKQKTQQQQHEFLQSFGSFLQCPKTKQDLCWNGHGFENANKDKYPLLASIPWLLPHPQSSLNHWIAKKAELNLYFENRVRQLKESLSHSSLPQTQERLNHLIQALEHNQKILDKILQPLTGHQILPLELSKDKIPGHQSLSLYLKNAFRDWAWKSEENKISLEVLKKIIPPDWSPERFLTLGAGASRLSIDIHRTYKLPCTAAVDINPLLLLIAQEMLNNNSLHLYELTTAPILMSDIAIRQNLKNDTVVNTDGFHLVFADAHHLPFKEKTFNSVLTPWLIDILPIDFSRLAERINRLLPVSGDWFNFGPLGFMFADESQCLTFEEIQCVLVEQGFEIKSHSVQQIPYLESPHASQKRYEKALCFRAVKIRDVKETDFQFLPDWLIDYSLPIPFHQKIRDHQNQAKVNADILFSIDGQRSIDDLTDLMSTNYKIPKESARQILISFFHKFYETQQRNFR